MKFKLEDYEVLFELVEEDIINRLKWLKSQTNKNYRMYNAGQIKALEYVLDIISIDEVDQVS
ncbi:hypothetical protein [Neobacillus sp. SuZ13]|uniref:hypothetical protein n=1 Tax=Neobacillus sp. SuZ13 TaxID=3047875 RepID=UPI0024BF9F1B|nr:hypothetical protein [Neobacillus sp. SuZ13]WHY65381.1 hypothetical protein QNH17_20120 [Neobacillus sp. SuZ13]